ncbi:nucleotidyltransferase family protein [Gaopeijia maritima]|uniref:Nucleotidyltransferase family protein n=1 Tax=Gaopeijia maritima TaxID=3119007 RepID=A0ABU9E6I1_9BACT
MSAAAPFADFDDASRQLVVAALGGREVAAAAWSQWSAQVTLDASPPAAFAVLPAVSLNLDRLELAPPEASRLRGIFRYAWTHVQLTLRDLFEAVEALGRAEVRALAHRGVPATSRALGHPAAVYADQVDLLVDPVDLDRAADVLRAGGWTPARSVPPDSVRSAFSDLAFEHAERRRVVLHWRSFPPGARRRCDGAILDRAIESLVQERPLLVPDPTDHLLMLSMRAPLVSEVDRVRWALELCALLAPEAGVDRAEFARRAEEGGVLAEAADALRWAARNFGDSLPWTVFPDLAGLPEPRRSGRVLRGGRARRAIGAAATRYSEWCRRHGKVRTPWGFVGFTTRFYAHEWEATGPGAFARAAVRRWHRRPTRSTVDGP